MEEEELQKMEADLIDARNTAAGLESRKRELESELDTVSGLLLEFKESMRCLEGLLSIHRRYRKENYD